MTDDLSETIKQEAERGIPEIREDEFLASPQDYIDEVARRGIAYQIRRSDRTTVYLVSDFLLP